MKCIEQTILTAPNGDCFAACVASILELPIGDVPNYPDPVGTSDQAWWWNWQKWLMPRNLAFIGWPHPIAEDVDVCTDILRGYSICTVRYEFPSGGVNHAVVCLNGELAWNPHPLRDTRKHDSIIDWIIFRVIDPSKHIDVSVS